MDQNFRIDILRIWRELVAELVLKYRPLVSALVLPAVLMAIADWAMIEFAGAVALVFTAIYWFFAAMFAVSTHRVVLLNPASLSNSWGIYVDRYVLRYIGFSFLIGLAMILPMIGATLLLAPMNVESPSLVGMLLMAVLWVTLIYLMVRLSMVLPAQAIGDRFGLVEMFETTTGNGWRLAFATSLPVIGAGILLYPLTWLTKNMSIWLAALPMAVSTLVTGLIGVAVLSCAYRELKRSPTFPTAPPEKTTLDS